MLVSKEFYSTYVCLPTNEVPTEVQENAKFFPYFSACCGALDGSLLHAFVSKFDMARFHSRKGFICTNLLAACLFCLWFCYILAGWEGSAADSRLFENAHWTDFVIEPGTYYLANAGFPLCDVLLVPYHGVRYHLKEWEQANLWWSGIYLSKYWFLIFISDLQTTRSCSIYGMHLFKMWLNTFLGSASAVSG